MLTAKEILETIGMNVVNDKSKLYDGTFYDGIPFLSIDNGDCFVTIEFIHTGDERMILQDGIFEELICNVTEKERFSIDYMGWTQHESDILEGKHIDYDYQLAIYETLKDTINLHSRNYRQGVNIPELFCKITDTWEEELTLSLMSCQQFEREVDAYLSIAEHYGSLREDAAQRASWEEGGMACYTELTTDVDHSVATLFEITKEEAEILGLAKMLEDKGHLHYIPAMHDEREEAKVLCFNFEDDGDFLENTIYSVGVLLNEYLHEARCNNIGAMV